MVTSAGCTPHKNPSWELSKSLVRMRNPGWAFIKWLSEPCGEFFLRVERSSNGCLGMHAGSFSSSSELNAQFASLSRCTPLRQIGAEYSRSFARTGLLSVLRWVHLAWPAAWTHGGVDGLVKVASKYALVFSVPVELDYD